VKEAGIRWEPKKAEAGEMPFSAWIEPHATGAGGDAQQAAFGCFVAVQAKLLNDQTAPPPPGDNVVHLPIDRSKEPS